MEQHAHDRNDDPQGHSSTDGQGHNREFDIRTDMMDRKKREQAMAWVQAYRLIRGGVVDEVVEFIEGSHFTIELLLQMLRDAACGHCEMQLAQDAPCDFCERRSELLSQLA